jgi:gluconate 2-dehydrogenase gamma chain
LAAINIGLVQNVNFVTINFKPKAMKSNRREFVKHLGLAFGSVMFVPACAGYNSVWRFFTEAEAKTILAFTEQIIPADQDPGATDANVINFIDKQLTGPYTRFQELYRKGIPAIENSSKKLYQKAFYELEPAIQTAFMVQMEKGELPKEVWGETNQQSFFRLVLDHTMQGFYGSPRHGGNKNYVSYKMMRLDYPHVIGQNRYDSTCAQKLFAKDSI